MSLTPPFPLLSLVLQPTTLLLLLRWQLSWPLCLPFPSSCPTRIRLLAPLALSICGQVHPLPVLWPSPLLLRGRDGRREFSIASRSQAGGRGGRGGGRGEMWEGGGKTGSRSFELLLRAVHPLPGVLL